LLHLQRNVMQRHDAAVTDLKIFDFQHGSIKS
jgi:hypothetical protein